ncbi:MAG TPA: tetratricopeptide repeat protein, partial [Anaeromyxobacteraceae bacterium]|nr:tetratricopeptide repeat protein [Anaeromyxobacteraceae bacterium]
LPALMGGPAARGRLRVAAVAALGLAAQACRPSPTSGPAPPGSDLLAEQAAEWRAQGLACPPEEAEARLAAGRAALAADLPGRTAEARRACAEALAGDRGQVAALACWVTAFAWLAGDDPDAGDLQRAHRLLAHALGRAQGRPDLLAARARLMALAPGEANAREALEAARGAAAIAPDGRDALLALGEALLPAAPAAAAGSLERAWQEWGDRRALRLSALARWRAGDPGAALDRLARRLEMDPAQPEALGLRVDIELGLGRIDAARTTLRRWAGLDPGSPRPLLGQARLELQLNADPRAARALLERALGRPADDFLRARLLSERAAAEAAGGDLEAARRSVAEALRLVPGSAPARFQEAALAWRRGDGPALREAAGVLGGRGGAALARLLQARLQVLERRFDEAVETYRAIAAGAGPDLELLAEAMGALARLQARSMALDLAAQASRRDPAEPRQRLRLRELWEAPLDLAEGADALADLARHEPARARQALEAAALVRILLGHTRAAEALARRAAAEGPDDARPLVLLAQVELDRGRPREALQAAEAALRREAGDAVAQALRARALQALGRGGEALGAWRQALAADPALPTARLGEALLAAQAGDRAAARARLEALWRDDPGQARARGALLDLRP